MSINREILDTVQKLYIAYYQRPADPKGLLYWAQKLEENGGNLNAIIHAFANSPEAQQLYGNKPVEEVIKEIYESVFNREPDPEGLKFYKEKVEKGEFHLEDVMLRILDGAKNEDAVILKKKVEVAHKFVEAIYPELNGQLGFSGKPEIVKYEGFKDAQKAREWLKKVVSSPDAPVPDINEIKVDLLAIADPNDPIVDEVKELMVEKPQLAGRLENIVTISPDKEMLEIVKEIKTHIEQIINQFTEQSEELSAVNNPETLKQIVSKLNSIEEHIPVVSPEGSEFPPEELHYQNVEQPHSPHPEEPVVVVEEHPGNEEQFEPSPQEITPPPPPSMEFKLFHKVDEGFLW